jgi:hypothetical protein
LIFLLPVIAWSQQEDPIYINGTVTNEKEVEGIHVLNKTSRFNTITGMYGNFSIGVRVMDTLVFSSIKYAPAEVVVTSEIYERGIVLVELEELVNELDEVYLGPDLTGLLKTDIENIKVEDKKNFQDFGIPGFTGIPQERIVSLPMALFPTSVNIEALYKHITGYYDKLRTRRIWDTQNQLVAQILDHYGEQFFEQAYGIPVNRQYDFLLHCIETTGIASDFRRTNYAGVLESFSQASREYLSRLKTEEE